MRIPSRTLFAFALFPVLLAVGTAPSLYAQDPNEVATPTSIYTVEASYMAGGSEWIRVRIFLEFAHVPGAETYSAQGWGPQQGERRWAVVQPTPVKPAESGFPVEVVAQPGNLLYFFGGGVARANDQDAINELYNELAADFRYDTYPWQVYGRIPDDFRTWVTFDADTVSVGETFGATLNFDHFIGTGPDLMNVMPTGPLSTSSDDGGEVSVESGPTPESIASMAFGDRSSMAYTLVAESPGTVLIEGMMEGEWDYYYPDKLASTSVCGEYESTPCTVVIVETGLIVNDTGDGADIDPGDGICDGDDEADGPQCTLRAALQEAEAAGEDAEIGFDLEGEGPYLITPESPLPVIGSGITLDATTQPGWVDIPLVRIDGSSAGGGSAGLVVDGNDVTVRGFMITGFESHGIHVVGGSGGLLETLIIGSDASGAGGMGNGGDGIHMSGGTDLTIGSEPSAAKSGAGRASAINIGRVISVNNLLNGLYARNESNAALIRSDIHTVERQEGAAAKGAGSAAQALGINLNVTNFIAGAVDALGTPVALPTGQNGICLVGITDALFDRVTVSDATMNAFEITASQRIAFRRIIAGLRRPTPQQSADIGRIGGSIFKIFQSLGIEVGSENASDDPVQGVAAEGWFMDAEDSEDVQARNIMAGLTANMAGLPSGMRTSLRNLAGGILMRNLLRGTVGAIGVPTILANNGGNASMPQAGLMAVGELSDAFKAVNLHVGTTPEGLPNIGNLGSGLILADGIRNAVLGGENPLERIISAGNGGYGFLLRDIGSNVPTKGGEAIQIASITRAITDMVPTPSGSVTALSNTLSGMCFLRARGVLMDMFSIGPSGRHGVETIDSSDLEFVSGVIGSLFEKPIEAPSDLMGPTENGFSFSGGSNISAGGPLGIGSPTPALMNIFVNNVGGSAVSADGVERIDLANMGIGTMPAGSVMSPSLSGLLGSGLEGMIMRNLLRVRLRRLIMQGNGTQSEKGVGAILAESSGFVELSNSILGGLTQSGQPDRPNAGTAVQINLIDSMRVTLNRFLGSTRGITAQMSAMKLDGNEFDGHTGEGGSGHAVKQTGGSLEAVRNSMTSNAGPAVVVAQMQNVLLRFNNFAENAIGVLNEDADGGNMPWAAGKSGTPGTVLAPDNWWGDPSGPGGEGTGSGDAISAGVVVDSWLTSANGIVISPERRVVEADEGAEVVIPVRFATPFLEDDVIDVTVTDERGWVTSQSSFSVDVAGSEGDTRDLEVSVSASGADRITIHAVSRTDDTLEGEAVVVVTEPGGTVPLEMPVSAGADVLDADGAGPFAVGGELVINPGGANEETVTIAGFGSILLAAPLRFDHAAGETIAPANRMAVDREQPARSPVPTMWDLQAYPNPVRHKLMLAFDAPVAGESRIEVFDLIGRRVAILPNRRISAGRHIFSLDVSSLPPGVYMARSSADGQLTSALVTVVR